MSSRVFISYTEPDAQQANEVAAALRAGGLAPLLSRALIGPGDSFISFMETSLSKSDYCLLLWSRAAEEAAWVRLEWEAALCRAVDEARAFLVVGRLEDHEVAHLLKPRLYVDLFPEIRPGIDTLICTWNRDRTAEKETDRPIAGLARSRSVAQDDKATLYVTSDYFGVTVPVKVDLNEPCGSILHRLTELLELPRDYSHKGQLGVRFDYRLVHGERVLERAHSLRVEGIEPYDVLWLEFDIVPFAHRTPRSGELGTATFRHRTGKRGVDDDTRREARRLFAAHVSDLGLGAQDQEDNRA